jgi:hypothetical protein
MSAIRSVPKMSERVLPGSPQSRNRQKSQQKKTGIFVPEAMV